MNHEFWQVTWTSSSAPFSFLSTLKGEDMATTDQRTVAALEHIYKELERQNKILIDICKTLNKLVDKETQND